MQRPCRFSCLLILAAGCSDGVDTSLVSIDGGSGAADALAADSGLGADAPATDQPPSPDTGAIALDAPPTADASGVDALSPPDVTRPDVTAPDVARTDAGTPDRPSADAGATDSGRPPDTGAPCDGPAPAVTVTAPAADEMIETCSASDAAVFYDFVASVPPGSSVQQVSARWITPDGAAAPPAAALSAAPFTFRRQVGGPTTGAPPLAVFGIRGTWRFEVTATDRCGRMTTASRNFTLVFTARRCPNP